MIKMIIYDHITMLELYLSLNGTKHSRKKIKLSELRYLLMVTLSVFYKIKLNLETRRRCEALAYSESFANLDYV